MIMRVRVRPEFTAGRGLEESLPLSGVGIGETEQFLLQTLLTGAASFGGGFLGARAASGPASGGQTPALQTLAAAVGPGPGPAAPALPAATNAQREAAAVAAATAAAQVAKRKRMTRNVVIGVGAAAALGTGLFLFARQAG